MADVDYLLALGARMVLEDKTLRSSFAFRAVMKDLVHLRSRKNNAHRRDSVLGDNNNHVYLPSVKAHTSQQYSKVNSQLQLGYLPSVGAHTFQRPNHDHLRSPAAMKKTLARTGCERLKTVEMRMQLLYHHHQLKLGAAKEQGRNEETRRKRQQSVVPVMIQIEHCNYLKLPVGGSRTGKVAFSTCRREEIHTLRVSLEDTNPTPLSIVKERIRRVYDAEFGDRLHRNHQHPSRRDGDVIMELSMKFDRSDEHHDVSERSWHDVLHRLAMEQLLLQRAGIPTAQFATLVAKFTCPAAGR